MSVVCASVNATCCLRTVEGNHAWKSLDPSQMLTKDLGQVSDEESAFHSCDENDHNHKNIARRDDIARPSP